MTDTQKTDRQKTEDGVTDKASTREAYASKNVPELVYTKLSVRHAKRLFLSRNLLFANIIFEQFILKNSLNIVL